LKNKQIATHRDLWKYGPILTIQKSLTIKWLRFLIKRFLIWVYYLIIDHILSSNNKFGMWIIFIFFPFCDVPIKQPVHIFQLQKSITFNKWIFLSINNHTIFFIIKFSIRIQTLISRSKDILITICIWMKGTHEQLFILSQKWIITQPCIHPIVHSKESS